jgi:hypothetical protein
MVQGRDTEVVKGSLHPDKDSKEHNSDGENLLTCILSLLSSKRSLKPEAKVSEWGLVALCSCEGQEEKGEPALVAHAYNPRNSGGRDQEDHGSKPVWAYSL